MTYALTDTTTPRDDASKYTVVAARGSSASMGRISMPSAPNEYVGDTSPRSSTVNGITTASDANAIDDQRGASGWNPPATAIPSATVGAASSGPKRRATT